MVVLHLLERLHGETEQALKSKMQTLCVRMGCSHATMILRGVCIQQTVFAPSFVEQSVHCVMCGAATVIMPIMSSRDNLTACFMVGTKNPDKEGGRES